MKIGDARSTENVTFRAMKMTTNKKTRSRTLFTSNKWRRHGKMSRSSLQRCVSLSAIFFFTHSFDSFSFGNGEVISYSDGDRSKKNMAAAVAIESVFG